MCALLSPRAPSHSALPFEMAAGGTYPFFFSVLLYHFSNKQVSVAMKCFFSRHFLPNYPSTHKYVVARIGHDFVFLILVSYDNLSLFQLILTHSLTYSSFTRSLYLSTPHPLHPYQCTVSSGSIVSSNEITLIGRGRFIGCATTSSGSGSTNKAFVVIMKPSFSRSCNGQANSQVNQKLHSTKDTTTTHPATYHSRHGGTMLK